MELSIWATNYESLLAEEGYYKNSTVGSYYWGPTGMIIQQELNLKITHVQTVMNNNANQNFLINGIKIRN